MDVLVDIFFFNCYQEWERPCRHRYLHQGSLRHQLQLLLHKEDFAWDAVWKGLAALRNSQQPQGAVALTRQRGWKQLDKGRPEAGESSLAPQRLRELSGILLRL